MSSANLVVPDFSEVAPVRLVKDAKEMLTVTQVGEQTVVKINPSSLSIISSCARKSFYKLEEKLQATSESTALTAGKMIHKAQEVFYTHSSKEREIPVRFEENAALLAYGQLPPDVIASNFLYQAIEEAIKVGEPLRALPESDKRSIPNLVWLLAKYFKVYIKDTYVVALDREGKPIVERTLEHVIYETPTLKIILFGTIDVVLKNEATGTVLPTDHKTFSQTGLDFLNRIKPNHQYTAYLLLAKACLGIDTDEFMVNGFHVVAKPKTANAKGAQHTRQITKRSEDDFREFIDAVVWAVQAYLTWKRAGIWPIGPVDSCAMWGGCEFLDVCSAPSNLRKNILEAKYLKPELANG